MEDREKRVPDAEGTEEVEAHKLTPDRAELDRGETGVDEELSGDDVEAHRLGPPGRVGIDRNVPPKTDI